MVERRSSGPGSAVTDLEVLAGLKRRQFPAEYKLRILKEADTCRGSGEVGALLRREELYSSHLGLWRRLREQAAYIQLKSRKRGPRPKARDARVKQLGQEKAQLERRLMPAETIIAARRGFAGRMAPLLTELG